MSLRSLQLHNLKFISIPDQLGRSTSISLPHLEYLNLCRAHDHVAEQFLLVLVPGTHGLRLRLALSDRDEMIETCIKFLKHFKVEALYVGVSAYRCDRWFAHCSPPLSQLHTLAIDLRGMYDLGTAALAPGDGSPRFPDLRAIHIAQAPNYYSLTGIFQALTTYPLEVLVFIAYSIGSIWKQ